MKIMILPYFRISLNQEKQNLKQQLKNQSKQKKRKHQTQRNKLKKLKKRRKYLKNLLLKKSSLERALHQKMTFLYARKMMTLMSL